MQLLPLLFKDLDIKYMPLFGAKVLLEKGPDSQGNWDFPAGRNSAGSIGVFKPTAIEADQISIENLHLTSQLIKWKLFPEILIAFLPVGTEFFFEEGCHLSVPAGPGIFALFFGFKNIFEK